MNLDAAIMAHAQKNVNEKLDKDVQEAIEKKVTIVDGQARAIAAGLFEQCKKDDFAPSPVSNHPYEVMCEEACKRFPHCKVELVNFFTAENERNLDPEEIAKKLKDPETYARRRAAQWQYFFVNLRELNTSRSNLIAISRRQEKKAKKGKKLGGRPGFRGPTIG